MALDKSKLTSDLVTFMTKAKDEKWEIPEAAAGLAAVIDAFVRSAEVGGVKSALTLDVPNNAGTGTQTGTVKLK